MIRPIYPFITACTLLLLTACRTPAPEAAPQTPPPAVEPTDPPEAPAPTPEPEPEPDYLLKIGDYQTSFEELESGTLDKSTPVTVVMNPDTEYDRAVEILTRVSDLGYLVRFQAAP